MRANMQTQTEMMKQYLAERTHAQQTDWELIDGPESGVGIERWYRNIKTGQEAYAVDNNGAISVSFA
jgi:hypothetical protein